MAKFSELGDPDALKTFLQYAPEPMPRLYPELLEHEDIKLIAWYLKSTLGSRSGDGARSTLLPWAVSLL
jgi:hypothetical protein